MPLARRDQNLNAPTPILGPTRLHGGRPAPPPEATPGYGHPPGRQAPFFRDLRRGDGYIRLDSLL